MTGAENKEIKHQKPVRGQFAGATFFVVCLAATAAHYGAYAALGVLNEVEFRPLTVGLLPLTATIVMGVTCRSWSQWRKWIWPWAMAAGVLGFMLANLNFYMWSESVVEAERSEKLAVERAASEAESRACEYLSLAIDQRSEIDQHRPQFESDGTPWGDHFAKHLMGESPVTANLREEYAQYC
ncbi:MULTISPECIES: hypothetical protein [unclassified Arthrobacter]|uniref:hypothetical protein n=1 Tax=unclassified Arthrobacter TaxID=235627 RepID=UPI0006DAEDC5|nr:MULTISPECIES: hypothetical protein [unclassified Arthrobacter]KPN21739.1 hypothetical protein AO716_01590 [Arthrobacter sp. Edens01]MSR97748.1 hypothetical protein [Arthrobacter sp. BL-252-APC-1A]